MSTKLTNYVKEIIKKELLWAWSKKYYSPWHLVNAFPNQLWPCPLTAGSQLADKGEPGDGVGPTHGHGAPLPLHQDQAPSTDRGGAQG